MAQALLELIYFFTNIFFFGRFSFQVSNPAHSHLGAWVIFIPAIGGMAVDWMIHRWEPTLKGHGIPEAMDAVLFRHSRMRIRVAILKPLATAFAIGTGGPFGTEGPIIQTGAALGFALWARRRAYSVLPQGPARFWCGGGYGGDVYGSFGRQTGSCRVVAVRAARPLLYSVALAAAVATGVRIYFAGWNLLFPTPAFKITGMNELWLFALMGILMGAVGIVMIQVLSWLEDFFDDLPIKRALIWSPVIGAWCLV